jgi:zinc-ribbon domain
MRWKRLIALCLPVLVAGAACSHHSRPAVRLTSLADVLSGRVKAGARITVDAVVTETHLIPVETKVLYRLSQPSAGSIAVVSTGSSPVVGERLRVSGVVAHGFKAGGVNLGTVIEERARTAIVPVRRTRGGFPLWAWLAIGGGILVLAVALALALRGRGREEQLAATCPHCGALVEPDWVACTECGRRLDAPAEIPGTMVSQPGPPPPSPQEAEEAKRRSAQTVLIPPDEEDPWS